MLRIPFSLEEHRLGEGNLWLSDDGRNTGPATEKKEEKEEKENEKRRNVQFRGQKRGDSRALFPVDGGGLRLVWGRLGEGGGLGCLGRERGDWAGG